MNTKGKERKNLNSIFSIFPSSVHCQHFLAKTTNGSDVIRESGDIFELRLFPTFRNSFDLSPYRDASRKSQQNC
jgi:hypothetical protein